MVRHPASCPCLETMLEGGCWEGSEHPPALTPRAAGSQPLPEQRGEGKHPNFREPASSFPPRCWQELGWRGPTLRDPPHLTHRVPLCSAAFPEATRRGLMASGICHLTQTTFHQCHPRPATGATCLITSGVLSTGAVARRAAVPSEHRPLHLPAPSSSSHAPPWAQVGTAMGTGTGT